MLPACSTTSIRLHQLHTPVCGTSRTFRVPRGIREEGQTMRFADRAATRLSGTSSTGPDQSGSVAIS